MSQLDGDSGVQNMNTVDEAAYVRPNSPNFSSITA